jgi:tetratricopeptide (TPR) repeat protein
MAPSLRCLSIALFLTLISFATGSAQDSARTWNLPRFGEDAAAIYDAASGVKPSEGTDAIVLDEEKTYVIDATGGEAITTYVVYKVLTQRGAEDWNEFSQKWAPWTESRPTVRARIITADKIAHILDTKTITDSPAKEDNEDTYSDRRVIRAPLPAVAVGCVVEMETSWTQKEQIPGAGMVGFLYFGRSVVVENTKLMVDAPDSLPITYHVTLMPGMKPQRVESNGRVKLTFESGALEINYNGDDSYWPADTPEFREVEFTTGKTWKHLAEEYSKIVDGAIAQADIKGIATRLVAGKSSREDKITAILEYLGREVRYTGIEFGESAIIPHSPAETLKNKYGDCKDKATLLLALLRAVEIPSYLALLDAGPGTDVAPDLPGMGGFDHAIVYVPGKPDLWIDATDEHARLGQLPTGDQGRLALIARNETDGLTTTRITSSQDNLLAEKREFFLAENGPARVVETSEPHGDLEAAYRDQYGDPDNKEGKKSLTDYVKGQYLTDKLDRVSSSEGRDLSKQFRLVLEMDSAKRGQTDLTSAVMAIRVESIFTRLPKQFRQRIEEEKAAEDPKEKAKQLRTADFQLSMAFATEWHYTVIPPPGFRPKPVPPDSKLSLGPALLTETFSAGKDGTVRMDFRFDTVKNRLTTSEADEMRRKIVMLSEGNPILIYFEPIALALLNEGKIRESLQEYRDLIALHPKEAIHHFQMAKALLSAGMGQAARDEAAAAVKIEPNSALAQTTLAEILECDLVGREFRRGSDYAGAALAYRAAQKLDSSDNATTANLAILLEHNGYGERYGHGSDLKGSIVEYQKLTEKQQADLGVQNNLAFTLFYAGEYAEAQKKAEGLNPRLTGLAVAAIAAQKGPKEGIAEAGKLTGAESNTKSVLMTAAQILMQARKYEAAAELFDAGASGANAANTMALASMLRKTRPREEIHYSDDPTGVVMKVLGSMMNASLSADDMYSISSKSAKEVIKNTDPEKIRQTVDSEKQIRGALAQSGLPLEVGLDLTTAIMEAKAGGNDTTGYRVQIRVPGQVNETMYVVKEEGRYKVLDTGESPNSIGLEILHRVDAGNLAGARVLLDWLREDVHLGGGDDPVAGAAFPRFWTKGQEASAGEMRLAGAAILSGTKETAAQGIGMLEQAKKTAKTDAERLNLSLALLSGYDKLDDYSTLLAESTELAKLYPESKTLFGDQQRALTGLGKYAEAEAQIQERLKRTPDDIDATRAQVTLSVAREDYLRAHELGQKIVAAGRAEAQDLNLLAWNSLFTGKVGDEDVKTALKAAELSPKNAPILHTLACAYAELGKAKEAREVLVQAMDILSLDEPTEAYWYGFGRIAEQYGEDQIALTDYEKVAKPKKANEIPGSSFRLAQNRIKILGNTGVKAKTAE